jgi:hypothetical protein
MKNTKKNKVHSPIVKNQKKSDGLLVNNGIVIDTTDEAFAGGICLDLTRLYK